MMPHLRTIALSLAMTSLLAVACNKKSDQDSAKQPDAAEHNARVDGVALQAAKDAWIGEWAVDVPEAIQIEDLEEEELEIVKDLAKQIQAAIRVKADGTFDYFVQVPGKDLMEQNGRWEIVEVELQGFTVEQTVNDVDVTERVSVKPNKDGTLVFISKGVEMTLSPVNLDELLKQ